METRVDAHPEKWSTADVLALTALRALTDGYVPWTAWSMRPAAVASIVNEIELNRPRTVVEIGAGASTVHLGHALQPLGGRLVSFEHDERHGEYVRRLLAREGLGDVVRVELVELTPWKADEADDPPGEWAEPGTWYDVDAVLAATPEDVDVLVVDGPPAGFSPGTLVRRPALDVLAPKLAGVHTVFLDDADRPAEREIVRRWGEDHSLDFLVVERLALAVARSDGRFVPTL